MASAPAATGINLTAHFDKARSEYEQAQAQMLLRAQALETMQKELKQRQQAVLDRERGLLSAATKDGVTAATATAVILAGNPAGAAKVRPESVQHPPVFSQQNSKPQTLNPKPKA